MDFLAARRKLLYSGLMVYSSRSGAGSLPSRSRYLLGRAALDLRTFTVAELASLTQVPQGTVHSFLHHLKSGVTKETPRSGSRGRPRKLYSLNPAGVDQLLDENLEVARLVRVDGLETKASQQASLSNAKIEQGGGETQLMPSSDAFPETLEDAYERLWEELGDLHKAELQVIEVLPRVTRWASNTTLQAAFTQQVRRTQKQNARLEEIFKELRPPTGQPRKESSIASPAITDLLQEAETRASEETEPRARDKCLLAAIQKVEHYRVVSYGTVHFFAQVLGERKAVKLLRTTLNEERRAAHPLFQLAGVIRAS